MDILASLAELAHSCALPAFQGRLLDRLADELDAEVGLFATPVLRIDRGLDDARSALDRGWDEFGRELAPLYAQAAVLGAATDVCTFGQAGLTRLRVYREVMAPLGGTESLFIVPAFRGQLLGVVMLGRTGGRFSNAAIAKARATAPWLSLACAAQTTHSGQPASDLSVTELDLLRYLRLGYSTRDIAQARATSYFTVRNQLSALYRKLGVANRAEAVGLRLVL